MMLAALFGSRVKNVNPTATVSRSKFHQRNLEAQLDSYDAVKIPTHGTLFKVGRVLEGGSTRSVPLIIETETPSKFVALFPADDTDFELHVLNDSSTDRDANFDVVTHSEKVNFTVPQSETSVLKSLKQKGKKFHFLSQSNPSAKPYVELLSEGLQGGAEEASKSIGCIMFSNVSYSPPGFPVHFKVTTKESYTLLLHPYEPILLLKRKKRDLTGIPIEDQHILCNRLYLTKKMDSFRVGDCHIQPNSTYYLIKRTFGVEFEILVGDFGRRMSFGVNSEETIGSVELKIAERFPNKQFGHINLCYRPELSKDYVYLCHKEVTLKELNITSATPTVFLRFWTRGGGRTLEDTLPRSEKGLLAFGNKSRQNLISMHFERDETIKVNDFTIELRLKPRFSLRS